MPSKNIKVLGIDTSCDDTAVSVMEIRNSLDAKRTPRRVAFEIRSNVVSSQVKLHAKYGGVYPFLAKREHQKNLPVVFRRALGSLASPTKPGFIDLIGVTVGPGLEPCLWQGINFAKEIAEKYKKPLIPVNHIEAHMVANFIGENSKFEIRNSKFCFPAVCLVVSGGHTQLILMKSIGNYKILGETRDDAAGECFDKVARILGLGYPGGPVIAQFAARKSEIRWTRSELPAGLHPKSEINLPRPMLKQKNYDFSFSGLKTAVLYRVQQGNYDKIEMCREVQQAIIDVLIRKTIKAAKDFGVKSILLGGGVAANNELREQFNYQLKIKNYKLNFLVPPKNLCTDNAAMVALTAFFHRTEKVKNIEAQANLRL